MEHYFLNKLFNKLAVEPFTVQYWDGKEETYGNGSSKFKIILNKPIDKKAFFDDPSMALGEAYMDGDIDYEGDIAEILDLGYRHKEEFMDKGALLGKLAKMKSSSLSKQKKDVQSHYDLGNDFYKLWLDETMNYSCGYFKHPQDSLYQAQINKINYILKKLNLQEGQTLLDIGSGWGHLIIQAAKKYRVKALGITLSQEQYTATKERIKNENLEDLVEVELMNYVDLPSTGRLFDRVVSVGMVEHVGRAYLPAYLETVSKILKPTGVFLLHSITKQAETETNAWIDKYIFPGGYIPSFRELIYPLPDYDFSVVDAESLRLHYAKTLEHWAANFEENIDTVKTKFDNRFIRMWRIYLNSCVASFRYNVVNIHQLILVKGVNNTLPMTREYLYNN